MDAKRGFVPEDERNFSSEAIETMKTASRHVCYLLDEGYDLKQATVFVGNHFLLSERQRLAITRSVASKNQLPCPWEEPFEAVHCDHSEDKGTGRFFEYTSGIQKQDS